MVRVIAVTTLAYIVMYVAIRLIGKKEVSQGTFWDFTSAIVIGSLGAQLATQTLTGPAMLAGAIIVWAGLTVVTGWLALKNRWVRGVLQSKPTVIIQNGKILEESMANERYNLDKLMEDLRTSGITSLDHVEFAILETNGQMSIIPKSQHAPLTPSDLRIYTRYLGIPTELIVDGQVVKQNLSQVGLDEEWLYRQLAARGATVDDVVLASLDTQGNLYLDLRSDALKAVHRPGDLPSEGDTRH